MIERDIGLSFTSQEEILTASFVQQFANYGIQLIGLELVQILMSKPTLAVIEVDLWDQAIALHRTVGSFSHAFGQ